jgi:maltooligosyltrehalose trehalohydrolase
MMFRVWAPAAGSVEVETSARWPLRSQERGWWAGVVPGAGPGTDYRFVLDGEAPIPDPRSAWQPHGIHGPSRVVDHQAFPWTDAGWQAPPLAAGVVYELHVGTFSPKGTFDGAIEYLGHLVDLGITHVEVMPVATFPGSRGWGYDGVALYAPHADYGGPDGFKRFVDACHRHRLAVILDVVYNHLGPAGYYLGRFGPYFTDRHRTPWGDAVNLDGRESDEVRRFFCDNAAMWLRDYHVDGLRLDAVHAFIDRSAVHFVEQLAAEVRRLETELGRHLVLVAESDLNDPRLVQAVEAGGYGLDAQWSDDFHHALHSAFTGERSGYYGDFAGLEDVARALERVFLYAGRYSAFRGRTHGRAALGLPGHRFMGYLQNHDQIGNRAGGERSSHLMSPGRLKVAAALVLLAPFVPLLFQGEEWGASTPFQYFTNHDDPGLAAAVTHGRREEFAAFGWDAASVPDPQAPETFDRSRLDWTERARGPHADVLAWHRALIRLRHARPALRDGRLTQVRVRVDCGAGWLFLDRGSVIVACNVGNERHRVPLDNPSCAAVSLCSAADIRLVDDGVELPPDAVAILVRD